MRRAIIRTGNKQYPVQVGDIIDVELLHTEEAVEFREVLLVEDGNTILVSPAKLANCLVKAEVLGLTKAPKVIAYKYKRRKNYRRKVGHRQQYTRVRIQEIVTE